MTQEQLVAICGINCLGCPAYVARKTDDNELREKTAKEWSSPEFSVKAEVQSIKYSMKECLYQHLDLRQFSCKDYGKFFQF